MITFHVWLHVKSTKCNQYKIGRGFVNNFINTLPVELRLAGYQFCRPGTKLKEGLARRGKGINLLFIHN